MRLHNVMLRMLYEANGGDSEEERKRKLREQEAKELEAEAEQNNEENGVADGPAEGEEASESEEAAPEEDPGAGEEMPEEGGEEEDPLGDVGDFSMDAEVPDAEGDGTEGAEGDAGGEPTEGEGGEGEEPAPDGLPEADDDGSGDAPAQEPEEVAPEDQNVQVNILKLSKLDRALAKQFMYREFQDLRSSLTTTLALLDRDESSIEPTVREASITTLNKLVSGVETYLKYRFPQQNYEDAVHMYLQFVQAINDEVTTVREQGLVKGPAKHINKGT